MRTNIKLEKVIEFINNGKRICPVPRLWNELYEKLPNKKRNLKGGWIPPLPLILAAWWESSNKEKKERFLEHLHWADKNQCLDEIFNIIKSWDNSDWLSERDYKLIDYWNNKIELTQEQQFNFTTPSPAEMFEWHRDVLIKLNSGKVEVKNFRPDTKQSSRFLADLHFNGKYVDELVIYNNDGKRSVQLPFYNSPFGVPCSYNKYQIEESLMLEIHNQINEHFNTKTEGP